MVMLVNLFMMFFRIGLFSFGGGYAMLPLIYQGVSEFGIMSAKEFSRLIALSQVTPGPIAVNAATYVGYKYAGIPGALTATFAVALPSFVLVIIAMHFLSKFKNSMLLNGAFSGIRPATVGLIAAAVVFLSETSIFNDAILKFMWLENPKGFFNPLPIVIFVITIFLERKYKIGPIKLTIIAGIVGAFIIR